MERRVQILTETEVKRALMRLSYEIIEKSEDLDKWYWQESTQGESLLQRSSETTLRNTLERDSQSVLWILLSIEMTYQKKESFLK